jgi:uncharacterized protein
VSSTEVRIDALAEGANSITLLVDDGELRLPEPDEIAIRGGVRADLEVVKVGDVIDVRGAIHGVAVAACARCAGETRIQLDVPIRLLAKNVEDRAGDPFAEDEDLVYHDGKVLDLADALRQLVAVSVPMAPLCRDDCRGLCPSCGTDLNVESCTCEERVSDPRWRVLGELLERERDT